MSFVNLHGHSHYSLLDGFGSPEDIVLRAKELGYPAAALTDHGVTYGLIELYKAGKKHGIKPILGCEFYVANRTRFDKEANVDVKPYHLTVLAKNSIGYQNILDMTAKAHLEGFYYKPRVDYGLLKAHSEGLIVFSGCCSAHIPRLILSDNEPELRKTIDLYIETFGKENFFFEVQDHPTFDNQEIVNRKLLELSKEYDVGLVATCDSHYPRIEDKEVHDILLCIQTGKNISDENRMRYNGDFSLRSLEDLQVAFADYPGAIENTVKIADMCNVEFEFGNNLIPHFDTPNNIGAKDYLRQLCTKGLEKRFAEGIPVEYLERLDYELNMVNEMGFDTYFLIVADFVEYAREKKIVVGPGRGSAAGAIIAWSLRITDVDPLKYGLFFERFLNPERVSMPDIDIDFSDARRGEVLQYVIDKYGQDKVAQVITYGKMAPKAAIRDVGRVLGYPYAEVDAISKAVPPAALGKYAPLVESIVEDNEMKKLYDTDPRAKVCLDYAKKLEGTVRHVGTHACAVMISEKPLTEYTALQYGAGGRGEIVTQYDAGPLESLGLLKMDFLGLRNLTIIEKTVNIVARTRGVEVNMDTLPMDDEKTFELLQKGDTTGVFQLESGGMRRYLKELKPTEFNDIVAMGALYRPGPMEWIPNYIAGKHDPSSVEYLDESFKDILATTYGVAVYQEQILQLARDFAGFSLGEADILRKAVGKKIPALLEEQRVKFVEGAVKNGHKDKFAKEVFEKVVEPFAGYGFNKAHAVCYGLIAYQTAYLKAHFQIEFMTALLCSDATNTDRVVLEIKECLEKQIDVLPPSVNESEANFTVVGENQIRFGLLAIKGVGDGPISMITNAREKGGSFKDLADFARRVESKAVNKKLIQALALSGAFDEFGDRNAISESYEEISKFAKGAQKAEVDGQASIFGLMDDDDSAAFDFELKRVPPLSEMAKLKAEKLLLGMYVSGHPLQGLSEYISRKTGLIGNLKIRQVDKKIKVVGLVTGLRKIVTKRGKPMAIFTVEDTTARVECVLFPREYTKYGDFLIEDGVVLLNGKLDASRGGYQIMAEEVKSISIRAMTENAKEAHTYDSEDKLGIAVRDLNEVMAEQEEVPSDVFEINIPAEFPKEGMEKLRHLLMENRGESEVELYLAAVDKRIRLPFKVELNDGLKNSVAEILVSS